MDNVGDVVTENAGEGYDTVYSSVTYDLSANVENLTLTGSANINGTGNTLDNSMTGNSGVNVLSGGAGNDNYYVDNAGDVVAENAGEGTDTVYSSAATYTLSANVENLALNGGVNGAGYGNALDNVMTGDYTNNTLDGGAGADTMSGGAGDDSYYVDNIGDIVTEAAGAGTDTVYSSINYTLGVNMENLTLTGTGNINGTGNDLTNLIIGNSGNNVLDGGYYADTMIGGAGDDSYYVDYAAWDVVTEAAGEGTDTVYSLSSYTLGANVENLTLLAGAGNSSGTGNALDNVIVGNSGNNTLDGGAGADTMSGGAGNDSYTVDNVGDVVTENAGEGYDTVYSSVTYDLSANVENLTLTGSANINGTGNTLDNSMTGNSGVNVLSGGAGNDNYYVDNAGDVVAENAGEGTDTVYSSAATYTLSANVENLALNGGVTEPVMGMPWTM